VGKALKKQGMSDGKTNPEVEAAELIAPADGDVVIDPAALAHLASDASLSQSGALAGDAALVLSLEDLLPDTEGAVVMLTDDSVPVSLVTDEPLAGCGIVDQQVSAGGLEVEGLFYYSFANGLTLYSDTDIVIVNETTGA